MYICMSNAGEFDVVAAVNLLGASVKESEAPIGMFGSGVKYALAQAIRDGRKIWITSGNQVWKVCYRTEQFRNKDFKVVYLQGKSGSPKKTAITSEFGSKDWTDPWFIFREFWSNMLDEGGSACLTDDIVAVPGTVRVYLEYKDFREIYDNIDNYFVDFQGLRSGTGRIFRQGVFVGSIEGLNLDLNCESICITETRTMNRYSAMQRVGSYITCDSVSLDHVIAFWRSDRDVLEEVELYMGDADYYRIIAEKHHEALTTVFGQYMIVPNMTKVVEDARQVFKCCPIVEHSGWSLTHSAFNRYDRQQESLLRRSPTDEEWTRINVAIRRVSQLIPNAADLPSEIRIVSDSASAGTWNFSTNVLSLSEQALSSDKELTFTMLHELGHGYTNAGDYDRRYVEFFQSLLVDLIM